MRTVSSNQTADGLLRGAAEALRPLVQRMLASGVPFGLLEARLRELVVEVAEQVTVDLPARAILDELVRTGAAELRDDDWVVLKSDAYVPKLGRAEKLGMLAEDPADLVETMLRNIFEEVSEPLLQRRVS